jgi:hypothetical protein
MNSYHMTCCFHKNFRECIAARALTAPKVSLWESAKIEKNREITCQLVPNPLNNVQGFFVQRLRLLYCGTAAS